MSRYFAAVLAVLAVAYLTASAQSQQPRCGDHTKIIALLNKQYQEMKRVEAITSQSALLEIFISPKGTYTILMTAGPITCIVSAGDSWQEQEVKPYLGPGL